MRKSDEILYKFLFRVERVIVFGDSNHPLGYVLIRGSTRLSQSAPLKEALYMLIHVVLCNSGGVLDSDRPRTFLLDPIAATSSQND